MPGFEELGGLSAVADEVSRRSIVVVSVHEDVDHVVPLRRAGRDWLHRSRQMVPRSSVRSSACLQVRFHFLAG